MPRKLSKIDGLSELEVSADIQYMEIPLEDTGNIIVLSRL